MLIIVGMNRLHKRKKSCNGRGKAFPTKIGAIYMECCSKKGKNIGELTEVLENLVSAR